MKVLQGCYKGVTRMLQGCHKGFTRESKGAYKECHKGATRVHTSAPSSKTWFSDIIAPAGDLRGLGDSIPKDILPNESVDRGDSKEGDSTTESGAKAGGDTGKADGDSTTGERVLPSRCDTASPG
jgi:hypothetical protein